MSLDTVAFKHFAFFSFLVSTVALFRANSGLMLNRSNFCFTSNTKANSTVVPSMNSKEIRRKESKELKSDRNGLWHYKYKGAYLNTVLVAFRK